MFSFLIFFFAGLLMGVFLTFYAFRNAFSARMQKIRSNERSISLLYEWLDGEIEGLRLENFFKKKGYACVGVISQGKLGKLFYSEMRNLGFDVHILINIDDKIDFKQIEKAVSEATPLFDVIVCAISSEGSELYSNLEKCQIPVVSLEDILFDVGIE